MKKYHLLDLDIVIQRSPFVDNTNKLETPLKLIIKTFQNYSDSEDVENRLPHFKHNFINNTSEIQTHKHNYTKIKTSTKAILKEANTMTTSEKRVRKKTLPCQGCDCNLKQSPTSLVKTDEKAVISTLSNLKCASTVNNTSAKIVEKSTLLHDLNFTELSGNSSEPQRVDKIFITTPDNLTSASEVLPISAEKSFCTITSEKRIRKKVLPCHGCDCYLEQMPTNSIKFTKTDENSSDTIHSGLIKTSLAHKNDDLLGDYKFNLPCKVNIGRVNINELDKTFNEINKVQSTKEYISAEKSSCSEFLPISAENSFCGITSEKRIRRKVLPCHECDCYLEQMRTNSTKFTKTDEINSDTIHRGLIKNPIVHKNDDLLDNYKFNLPCKVHIERVSFNEPVKTFNKINNKIQTSKEYINYVKRAERNSSNTISSGLENAKKPSAQEVNSDLCQDYKCKAQCKVLIEQININEVVTTSNVIQTGKESVKILEKNAPSLVLSGPVNAKKIPIEEVNNYLCQDYKCKAQCKVLIEQININEVVTTSNVIQTGKESVTILEKNAPSLVPSESVNANKIPIEEVNNYLCQDYKFKLQCKVPIERANINELVKPSNRIDHSSRSGNSSNRQIITTKITGQSMRIKNISTQLTEGKEADDDSNDNFSSPQERFLRNQVKPNYAEISLDTSQEQHNSIRPENKIATKVPVYKQQIEDKKNQIPDNLYEFNESDSDKDKQHRKGKRFPNKSHKRDTSLYVISQKNYTKKAKSKIKRQGKGMKVLRKPARKYNDIMQEIMQKVMIHKINHDHKPVNEGTVTNKNIVQVPDLLKKPQQRMSVTDTNNTEKNVDILSSNINKSNKALLRSSNGLSEGNENPDIFSTPTKKPLTDITNVPHLELLEISSDNIKTQGSLKKPQTTKSRSGKTAEQENSNQNFLLPSNVDLQKKSTNKNNQVHNITVGNDNSGDLFPPEPEINKEDVIEPYRSTDKNIVQVHNITVENHNSGDLFPPESEINKESVIEHHRPGTKLSSLPKANLKENLIVDTTVDSDEENGSESDIIDDSFLDFDDEPDIQSKAGQKITVISNVLLNKKNGGLWTKSNNAKLLSGKQNPWRFNDYVKRNPHFIILKASALPCLKQDMVLDHSQLERIEEHFSKTPRRIGTPRRSPVQKSMLDYVNVPGSNNKENHPRSSLFDYDDFSPIKTRSTQQTDSRNKVKRNILAPIQGNALSTGPITSTPTSNKTQRISFNSPSIIQDENEDIANYFGFDDDEPALTKPKPSEAKPFRVSERAYKKRVRDMQEIEKPEENLPIQEASESLPVINSMDVDIELFEDPEKEFTLNVPSKIYQPKPRRKRLKSVGPENELDHPKRRKKDMMTKAEELELENWAAKFNNMCKEIEKYDLEIE